MELETANNIVCDINVYYSNNSIYKSFIICNNDDDVTLLSELMFNELYSVYKITTKQIENEINTNIEKYVKDLIKFNNQDHRVIIVSFYVWVKLNTYLELYVLPEQNLIVLILLNEEFMRTISSWLYDTINRGFITRPDSYVLKIIDHTDIDTYIETATSTQPKYSQQVIQLTESVQIRKNNISVNYPIEYVF